MHLTIWYLIMVKKFLRIFHFLIEIFEARYVFINELIIESSLKWNFPKKLFKKIGKTTIVITIFVE